MDDGATHDDPVDVGLAQDVQGMGDGGHGMAGMATDDEIAGPKPGWLRPALSGTSFVSEARWARSRRRRGRTAGSGMLSRVVLRDDARP